MQREHTPGPWGLRGYQVRADNGLGQHVATVQNGSADGALVAAAPELLAVAEKARHILVTMADRGIDDGEHSRLLEDLEHVITKARTVSRG